MMGIQETVQKNEVKAQLKHIEKTMDGYNLFHPEIASIYNVESDALRRELRETLQAIPLQEFLAKSGTTGIAGAIYLVPDKLHDDLIYKSYQTDKVPFISAYMVNGWNGGDLKVDIVCDAADSPTDQAYLAYEFSSGGQIPTQTVHSTQATLSPISFGIAPRVTSDLIEDGNFELIQYHIDKAAFAIGIKATSLALTVLNAPPDGWGTLNTAASGNSQETKWMGATTAGISEAIAGNLDDHFVSNTIVTTGKAWTKSISETLPVGSTFLPVKEGFHHCVNNMDILLHTHAADFYTSATRHNTIVFDRNNAMLTGRKRWMQINNYSDPVKDLAGCTITCRQDSITLYKDSVYVIVETA